MIKTDLHPHALGTEHDSVLAGVAQGLHELFPPIHNPVQVNDPRDGTLNDDTEEQDAAA